MIRAKVRRQLELLEGRKQNLRDQLDAIRAEIDETGQPIGELKEKIQSLPEGSRERADASKELRKAREELRELQAEREGRYRQRAAVDREEAKLLESLQLERPAIRESTREAIRAAARQTPDGHFLDANTGEIIVGEPALGHKYGREHRRLVLEAADKGMSQAEFNDWVNAHPEWFQLETTANNLSHRFEKPGVD